MPTESQISAGEVRAFNKGMLQWLKTISQSFYTILTGVVQGSGSGTISTTITAGSLTNAMLADMLEARIKGRASGAGTGVPTDLTAEQVRTILGMPAMFSGSGTLDFGSTAAGASTDLTVAVTGAVLNDCVALGVPHGSTLANGVFSAWVSAADVCTIRFTNTNLVAALDPASGTFKVVVMHP